MTMDPKDRKSEAGQGRNWERDLEVIQANYSGLEANEPPDLLDQAILNTARREMAAKRRKPLRWIGAFATASVFVLALTIVLQQDHEPMKPGRPNGAKLDAAAPPEAQERSRRDAAGAVAPDDGLQESRSMERSLIMKQSAAGKREDGLATEPVSVPASAPVVAEFEETELKSKTRQNAPMINESAARKQAADKPVDTMGNVVAATADKDESGELADPEEWIQRLLLLRQSELYEKLEEELAAFRKAYPDHPLPRELEN